MAEDIPASVEATSVEVTSRDGRQQQTEDELIDLLVVTCDPANESPPELPLEDKALLVELAGGLFDRLNNDHFLGRLDPIPIDISRDLEFKAVLYYRPECRVAVSLPFIEEAGFEGLRQALLHEMVHYFFHFHGIKDTSSPLLGHSKRFCYVGDRVGLTLYN